MRDRIVFFGRDKHYGITLACYEELLRGLKSTEHELVLTVVTDDGSGEDGTLSGLAAASGLAWTKVPGNDVNGAGFLADLKRLAPSVCITVQFPMIYSPDLIGVPSRACLNVHRGWPLRGGSIDERAIFCRLDTYNVVLHHIDPGVDTGRIIDRVPVPVEPLEDGYSLVKKADEAGRRLFADSFLPLLGRAVPRGHEQKLDETSYGGKGSLSDRIDLAEPSAVTERRCRAFHHPRKHGAFLEMGGGRVYIVPPVDVVCAPAKKPSGTVLGFHDGIVLVKTADGAIGIRRCHLGDGRGIDFMSFIAKQNLQIGDNVRHY